MAIPKKKVEKTKEDLSEKISPFEIVKRIFKKSEMLTPEEVESYYKPFIINRFVSNFSDLIFFAQEMNKSWHVDALLQYHFYYYSIDKKNRYSEWPKKDDSLDEKIKIIKEYYGYSTLRARETLPLIDELNLWDTILKELDRGGKGKSKKVK